MHLDGKKFFAIRGYMKSGTNWLSRLLNLHPNVSCVGEFHWENLTGQMIEMVNNSHDFNSQAELIDHLWLPMDEFIKKSIVLANDPYATWVGDRTPSHIEPNVIIGAKIFNLIRDGRDVAVSSAYHFLNWPERFPQFTSIPEMDRKLKKFRNDNQAFLKRPKKLLDCEPFFRSIVSHWKETIETNQNRLQENPQLQCLEVRYEQLHADVEVQRKRAYEFLGVDPNTAAPLEWNTTAGFEVERPEKFLRKGSVGDWQNYFFKKQREWFKEVAGKNLIELEYESNDDW